MNNINITICFCVLLSMAATAYCSSSAMFVDGSDSARRTASTTNQISVLNTKLYDPLLTGTFLHSPAMHESGMAFVVSASQSETPGSGGFSGQSTVFWINMKTGKTIGHQNATNPDKFTSVQSIPLANCFASATTDKIIIWPLQPGPPLAEYTLTARDMITYSPSSTVLFVRTSSLLHVLNITVSNSSASIVELVSGNGGGVGTIGTTGVRLSMMFNTSDSLDGGIYTIVEHIEINGGGVRLLQIWRVSLVSGNAFVKVFGHFDGNTLRKQILVIDAHTLIIMQNDHEIIKLRIPAWISQGASSVSCSIAWSISGSTIGMVESATIGTFPISGIQRLFVGFKDETLGSVGTDYSVVAAYELNSGTLLWKTSWVRSTALVLQTVGCPANVSIAADSFLLMMPGRLIAVSLSNNNNTGPSSEAWSAIDSRYKYSMAMTVGYGRLSGVYSEVITRATSGSAVSGIGVSGCPAHSSGTFCAKCDAGYYLGSADGACIACPKNNPITSLALLLAFVILITLILGIFGGSKSSQNSNVNFSSLFIPIMQIVTYFQLIDLTFSIKIQWPVSLFDMLGFLSWFNVDIAKIGLECVVPMSFAEKYALFTGVPVGFAVLIALIIAMVFALSKTVLISREKSHEFIALLIRGIVFLLRLLFLPLTVKAIALFDCVGSIGGYRLNSNPDIKCYTSGAWMDALPYAILGVVIYTLIPVILFLYVYSRSMHINTNDKEKESSTDFFSMCFSQLVSPYHRVGGAYEIVLLVRKAGPSLAVFLITDVMLMCVGSMLISAATLIFVIAVVPFNTIMHNVSEIVLLFCNSVTFMLPLLRDVQGIDDSIFSNIVLGISIVGLVCGSLPAMCVDILGHIKKRKESSSTSTTSFLLKEANGSYEGRKYRNIVDSFSDGQRQLSDLPAVLTRALALTEGEGERETRSAIMKLFRTTRLAMKVLCMISTVFLILATTLPGILWSTIAGGYMTVVMTNTYFTGFGAACFLPLVSHRFRRFFTCDNPKAESYMNTGLGGVPIRWTGTIFLLFSFLLGMMMQFVIIGDSGVSEVTLALSITASVFALIGECLIVIGLVANINYVKVPENMVKIVSAVVMSENEEDEKEGLELAEHGGE